MVNVLKKKKKKPLAHHAVTDVANYSQQRETGAGCSFQEDRTEE